MARNPKDTIVSYYHHHRLIKKHGYDGNLEDFAEFFMKDERMCIIYCSCILIVDFSFSFT